MDHHEVITCRILKTGRLKKIIIGLPLTAHIIAPLLKSLYTLAQSYGK